MENVETPPSVNAILTVVRQIPIAEIEQLVDQLIAIRAKLIAPHLTADESALLARINKGLLAEDSARMRAHRKARRRDNHRGRTAGIGSDNRPARMATRRPSGRIGQIGEAERCHAG